MVGGGSMQKRACWRRLAWNKKNPMGCWEGCRGEDGGGGAVDRAFDRGLRGRGCLRSIGAVLGTAVDVGGLSASEG